MNHGESVEEEPKTVKARAVVGSFVSALVL